MNEYKKAMLAEGLLLFWIVGASLWAFYSLGKWLLT